MVIAWLTLAIRQARSGTRQRRIFWICLGAGVLFGLVACMTLAFGPWSLHLGPISLTGARFRKPLSIAFEEISMGKIGKTDLPEEAEDGAVDLPTGDAAIDGSTDAG